MANTFIKIQSIDVGVGGAASIDFTSIPQTYTDLKLVTSLRGAAASVRTAVRITFNSSSSSYSGRFLRGYDASTRDSGATSTSYFDAWRIPSADQTATIFSNDELYIPNYTSSNFKCFTTDNVCETNLTSGTRNYMSLSSGLWSNTSAITRITLVNADATNFVQYSTATLYGIKSS
jgi:hypothetical protein